MDLQSLNFLVSACYPVLSQDAAVSQVTSGLHKVGVSVVIICRYVCSSPACEVPVLINDQVFK